MNQLRPRPSRQQPDCLAVKLAGATAPASLQRLVKAMLNKPIVARAARLANPELFFAA